LFARYSPSVVQVVCRDERGDSTVSGSGFIIGKQDRGLKGLPLGLIATNYHVIERAHAAQIVCSDGLPIPVLEVVAVDEASDLAIVTAAVPLDSRPLDLAADELPVGAKVYAIGNPLGLANTLSDGLVSGYREMDNGRVIQTTAPISPGSSGGPLLAADGRVVGVTTFLFRGGQNLNFAVPAARAERLLLDSEAGRKPAVLPLKRSLDAKAHTLRGLVLCERKEYVRAITEFDQALKLDPRWWQAYVGRGTARSAQGELEKAITDYTAVIKLRPNPEAVANTYYNRGNTWMQLRKSDKAIAEYGEAIGLDPKMAWAFCNRGRAHTERKEFDQAITDLTTAIRLQPGTADFFAFRGLAWYKKKDFGRAE
jgi:Tfp pilus assembly protein PilF